MFQQRSSVVLTHTEFPVSFSSRQSIVGSVAVLLALLPWTTPAVAATAPSALVMHREMLFDPYSGMNAVSVLVPAVWEMKGSVNWVPGDAGGPQIDIAVVDPAQRTAVRMYPDLFFDDGCRENQKRAIMRNDPSGRTWATLEHFYQEGAMMTPGIEIRQLPGSPRGYVLNVLVPRLRPALAAATDITVVSETLLPDVDRVKTAASIIPNAKFTSSRIRLAYTGPRGAMDEEFICTIRSWPTGKPPWATTMWDADVTSAWAPRDKLDALLPTCYAITASRQQLLPHLNFVFQIGQMINQRWNDKLQEMIKNENERIRIYGEMQRQASAEVSQEIRDRFQKQMATKALVQENFMHYINNTGGFINPTDGSTLILPRNFKFTYINSLGDTFQTMDPALKPPVDPKASWSRMNMSK